MTTTPSTPTIAAQIEALQRAWDVCKTLPPIEFSESEATAIVTAIRQAEGSKTAVESHLRERAEQYKRSVIGTTVQQAIYAEKMSEILNIEADLIAEKVDLRTSKLQDMLRSREWVVGGNPVKPPQAEAAPGVVEGLREEAAMRVAKALYGDNFDPFTNPEAFEICQTLADAALARQHGTRELYRHLKRGTVYEVIGTAELQAEQPQYEHAELAIYRGEDGKLWARNTAEFHDGRFVPAAPATDAGEGV